MINAKDLYTYNAIVPIITDNDNQIGVSINQYEVKKYTDLKNLCETNSYVVTCTQRIIIPNKNVYNLAPEPVYAFDDYPALLTNKISIAQSTNSGTISKQYLLKYTPKTLNTTIMSDVSASTTAGTSFSQQHTTGSSTSQTNSYGASVNIGFFGETPTGGVSANYEYSGTKGYSSSDGTDRGANYGNTAADSESMSIKDWGSYAVIDNASQTPTWIWGQEYPWNVIQFRNTSGKDNHILLPDYVVKRLYIDQQISPPSQLSLFCIDFTSKASWYIQMSNDVGASITLQHTLNYLTASHGLDNNKLFASMRVVLSDTQFSSDVLDLPLLALDPISSNEFPKTSVTGFLQSKFTVVPAPGKTFEIVSGANNLLCRGQGFIKPMFTDFSGADKTASLDVFFKILDSDFDYILFLKCWKTTTINCIIKITINGEQIEKNVTSLESEGGENNLISINLRNKNYASAEYHDFLKLGLNTIKIEITPEGNSSGAGFFLRTLAIG